MEHKDMAYRARLLVCRAMSEPNTGIILEEMAEKKPQVFVQSVNTAYLAAQLAEAYGFDGPADKLVSAALLHDAGMLQVPDDVMMKQGRLDEHEKAVVKAHVAAGVEMLRELGFGGIVTDVAAYHHERSDGSGYPNGFESPDIPRAAKIVLVCDVYEAMTTDRPQRKAFNMYEATSMMESMPMSRAILQAVKRCADT